MEPALSLSEWLEVAEDEVELHAIRAQGPGGQQVNKSSTAIHLRFDIAASSLPERYKQRLLASPDGRISSEGTLVIKADCFRSQGKNRQDALNRLFDLVRAAGKVEKKRRPTRPTKAAKERRMEEKNRRGKVKQLRGRVDA